MVGRLIQWIKSHLTVVVCGSLGVVSLVMLALGIFLADLQTSMAADAAVLSNLQSGKAVNAKVIEEVRAEQNNLKRQVEDFLAKASRTTPRTPIHPKVFPAVADRFAPKEFKTLYFEKLQEFLTRLKAQDKPTNEEVNDYFLQLQIEELRRRRDMGIAPETSGGGTANWRPSVGGLGGRRSTTPTEGANAETGPTMGSTDEIPAGVTLEQWVARDAGAGAAVQRAQQISCYTNLNALDPQNQPVGTFPTAENMWRSQLSLWIQEDLVNALAKINEDAAAKLPEDRRWVAYLPVKRLLYVSISGYVTQSTAAGPPRFTPPMPPPYSGRGLMGSSSDEMVTVIPPPGNAAAVFTNRTFDPEVDVVQIALSLVVQADQLIHVVDEVSKAGFYTPLSVSYEAVPPNSTLRGYIYGPDAVVQARLEFEHCIMRKRNDQETDYEKLKPASIKSGAYTGGDAPAPDAGFGPSSPPPGRGGRWAE